jgi:hypothetical protein
MTRDFDWGVDNEHVVLRAYGSVAVHENPYGDVVIRQERDALEEDDSFVVVPVQDAELVAQAIMTKAAELKAEWGKPRQPEPESGVQPRLALLPPPGLKTPQTVTDKPKAPRGVA